MPDTNKNRLALAILTGFTVARLLFAFSIGFGTDESYTVAISRRLSLSYFDHPPLHLWITRLAVLALGENVTARVVFVGLFFATGWIYYRVTSRLFGPRSALIALFALNVTPFFFASAGGWVVPDGPLLFGLVVAAWAASPLFFPKPVEKVSAWRFWPIVGLGLGLAGLSKYSAILTAGGLVTFMLLSPEQRHWFKHPAPYVSAILACAMITPVVLWNAQHGWVSFEFQGDRGVPSGQLRPSQLATMAFGEIAFLSPWIFAALVAGLANAFRTWTDERRFFLLCLSLPPILLFTLTPLWGGRGQPHWTMPGWFFAFSLMGIWVDQLGISINALRRWALVTAVLLTAIAALAVVQASTGWPWVILTTHSGVADPMLESFEWGALKNARIFHSPPDFVISTKWSDAGKIAVALGPQIPVFVLSNDPRGWAFLDESGRFVGQNGVIVTPAADVASTLAMAGPLFAEFEQPQLYTLGRSGRPEIKLALIPATGLTHRLPIPYPSAAGR
jgi:4-amino-4-deoxy-L-arabinose transferase-like glycosyltransferase